jgi:hypothetical protein
MLVLATRRQTRFPNTFALGTTAPPRDVGHDRKGYDMFTQDLKIETWPSDSIAKNGREACAAAAVARAMNPWKRLRNKFNALMEEEDRIVREGMGSDCSYAYIAGGGCWVEGSPTESLLAQCELLATEAGLALGPPTGTLPLAYWLLCLSIDLRANKSKLMRLDNIAGGFIDRLFEASAIYCARLDRQSIEQTVMPHKLSLFDRKEANPRNEFNEGGAIETGGNDKYSDVYGDPDLTSDGGRRAAVCTYTNHWTCSEAALARAAGVDPADLSKWKKGHLPTESDKRARIERALTKNKKPVLCAQRLRSDL